ncbi:MAG: hypothetical protein MnENMB40S_33530 [Rhizobiaceae bacterium MnEN-MB40S]|nr:MAG: hypothetical protein MnENMB40S_33530 [Rhizobiaceae bacterium MnEN-MB40S]
MIRLINSPLTVRRIVALLVLLTLVGVIIMTGLAAFLSVGNAHTAIHEQRIALGRLQSAISQMSHWNDSSRLVNSGASFGFLDGLSETIIRADLQKRFMAAAADHRVNVISVGNVPNFIKNAVNYAGLQANVSGTIGELQQLLIELETTSPILFITEMSIRAPNSSSRTPPRVEPPLEAQLRVYGALRPDSEQEAEQ